MTGHGRVAKRAFSAAALTAIGFVLSAGADNLREIVLGAGGEFAFAHHALLAPGDAVAARAFDGDCFGLGDAGRCLGSAGMHVAAGFPDSVVPDGCKLAITRYRVYQLQEATGCHSRAPRAWRIEGASALDGTYAVIDSQSGVQWYSDTVSRLADNAPLPAGETNWREFTIDPGTNTDWRAF